VDQPSESNVHRFPQVKETNRRKSFFRFVDLRDSSLVPLQIILFILAIIETVQAIAYIIEDHPGAQPHIYSHLGSYMLAYASALFVIAARPARARGLLIITSVAAFGFFATSVIDILRGRAGLAGESAHLTKLLAPIVVWIIASRVIHFSRKHPGQIP
jgi:hypothetical protein